MRVVVPALINVPKPGFTPHHNESHNKWSRVTYASPPWISKYATNYWKEKVTYFNTTGTFSKIFIRRRVSLNFLKLNPFIAKSQTYPLSLNFANVVCLSFAKRRLIHRSIWRTSMSVRLEIASNSFLFNFALDFLYAFSSSSLWIKEANVLLDFLNPRDSPHGSKMALKSFQMSFILLYILTKL